MSCNSYRHELSCCLDGRLASNARARVMEHVAHCSSCARFWEELKAAQELVLTLPESKVRRDFRDDVWQRIQAGEGAADNVIQAPIPTGTKVRYGLAGAAAAAVFILAVQFIGPRDDGIGGETYNKEDLAKNEPSEKDEVPSPGPGPIVDPDPITDVTPATLAQHTVDQVQSTVRKLRNRTRDVTGVQDLRPDMVREMRGYFTRIRGGVMMLKCLEDVGIEVDGDARDCLTRARALLQYRGLPEQPEELISTAHALTKCSLDRLHRMVRVPLIFPDRQTFGEQIWRWQQKDPEMLRSVGVVIKMHVKGGEIFIQQMRPTQMHRVRIMGSPSGGAVLIERGAREKRKLRQRTKVR